jgi:hypothetical protein
MFSSNTTQVSQDATYIEDVFSTWLYTGNSSTQTITNGIDLAGKGGLVWIKRRTTGAAEHNWTDTVRGSSRLLQSSTTSAQITTSGSVNAFNTNGFFLNSSASSVNLSGEGYVSWAFREQPKFFDIVTWEGDSVPGRTVAHNLGSVPGCIIVKNRSVSSNWIVYHRADGATPQNNYLILNSTIQSQSALDRWNNTAPTATEFTLGDDATVNAAGDQYVAYIFAHNAGGFGLTGTDNVITCGSYTGTGAAGNTVNLGYEPQLVIIKGASIATGWSMFDSMRGFTVEGADALLTANTSSIESSVTWVLPTATGFSFETGSSNVNASGNTYVYIAIRRGPMKVPTTGTSVFAVDNANNSPTAPPMFTGGFPVDIALQRFLGDVSENLLGSRLQGTSYLQTQATAAQSTDASWLWDYQAGWRNSTTTNTNLYSWMWRRAPSFCDVVCYTGNGANRTLNHNLGVVPELIIVKSRTNASYDWAVYSATTGNNSVLFLNTTAGPSGPAPAYWNSTTPTASVFSLANGVTVNESGANYVAYLFASCPGVSKVGSYTGTGSTQTVNCGFTGGARFVLVKRATASTSGNWRVYDTLRGMVAGTDPYFFLNSDATPVNADSIYTASTGFEVVGTNNDVNASGSTYLYLAIA